MEGVEPPNPGGHGATVTSGAWQHVAATFGAGGLKFYLNGQAVFTTTLNAPVAKSWR
jgi:hypothetical protein